MVVPPFHTPKWSFFSRIFPWLSGKPTIFGNPHIKTSRMPKKRLFIHFIWMRFLLQTIPTSAFPYTCIFRSKNLWSCTCFLCIRKQWIHIWVVANCHLGGGFKWFSFLPFFTLAWGNDPIWRIFFKWVETLKPPPAVVMVFYCRGVFFRKDIPVLLVVHWKQIPQRFFCRRVEYGRKGRGYSIHYLYVLSDHSTESHDTNILHLW